MVNGAHNLVCSAVPWTLFATLTFRRECSEKRALRSCARWLRWVAHISGVKFKRLCYVVRVESGEVGGRLHLHVLIVVPDEVVSYFVVCSKFVPVAHRRWGEGMTKFRRCALGDPAVSYVLKETSGADEYEQGKTSRAQHLVLSNSLRRVAAATSKRGTGTAGGQNQSGEHTGGTSSLSA